MSRFLLWPFSPSDNLCLVTSRPVSLHKGTRWESLSNSMLRALSSSVFLLPGSMIRFLAKPPLFFVFFFSFLFFSMQIRRLKHLILARKRDILDDIPQHSLPMTLQSLFSIFPDVWLVLGYVRFRLGLGRGIWPNRDGFNRDKLRLNELNDIKKCIYIYNLSKLFKWICTIIAKVMKKSEPWAAYL